MASTNYTLVYHALLDLIPEDLKLQDDAQLPLFVRKSMKLQLSEVSKILKTLTRQNLRRSLDEIVVRLDSACTACEYLDIVKKLVDSIDENKVPHEDLMIMIKNIKGDQLYCRG